MVELSLFVEGNEVERRMSFVDTSRGAPNTKNQLTNESFGFGVGIQLHTQKDLPGASGQLNEPFIMIQRHATTWVRPLLKDQAMVFIVMRSTNIRVEKDVAAIRSALNE